MTVYSVEDDGKTRKKCTKRSAADQIQGTWICFAITQENLADLISRAEAASALGLASLQALSSAALSIETRAPRLS
ncbi:hypothetical protein MF271_22950 (plasmid) [Deinococcus sp. KNUC1210]|uniref:hypothetical protein n=1 Tax=Deinococcus sp. KNUC1210 TaxID=2917691 RepID=UPI001EF03D29|nr:hypothetical protein [Deinococcus sp. KNUC1210]ULH18320.1 hypothetical protein MF271_22950 [Deinococcus sp. KNUC1210]